MRIGLIVKLLCAQSLLALLIAPVAAKPCIIPPVSDSDMNRFKSNPDAVVGPTVDARAIEASVRDLAGTDASLAAEFVRLSQALSPRLRTAVAAGLAQAAVACEAIDQRAALVIQQSVAGYEDGEFQNAFAAVAGDLSTAAAEAAASSADSAVGSVIVTNANRSTPLSRVPGGGGSSTIFQINSTGVANRTSTSNSGGTATAASPVSATR
jgi:hypothetical protein